SALGEDSSEATFAGQQETYLWVRGAEGVCDAVRDCWVSLYSPPAIAYRARLGELEPAMGVAVQVMVDAEVSGVMVTCNPVGGDLPASLFVLQTRPVTAKPRQPDQPKPASAMDLLMSTFGAGGDE